MKNFSKTLVTVLITVVLTLVVTFAVLYAVYSSYDFPLNKLHSVLKIIDSSYVDEYDTELCEENAINAVLESIGDKYAVYYDEENAAELMQTIDGYYTGIGIEIFGNTQKGRIEVISAYEDSPAEKAGIKSGDLIVSIDGKEYSADMLADAVTYMKGIGNKDALNKAITMVISRDGEELSLELKRDKIELYKVTSEIIDDVCYIRYSGFTEKTTNQVIEIVEALDTEKVTGIIFDVRNNGGGEFNSAINLCDLFLDDGMIMYTVDKDGKKTIHNAKKGGSSLPLAIIVNGSSASASEIFAGSLQSRQRAVIVGEKTYGKGVSQTVRYLNPLDKTKGALKLTTCKNYTPDGKWINEAIMPDIDAQASQIAEDIKEDAAVKAALNSLK